MLNKTKLDILVDKMKYNISKELDKGNMEASISQISTCAKILYETNQTYYDQFLEEKLIEISDRLNINVNKYSAQKDTILFFDSFGLENRGLAQIYLKAFLNIGKIIYVTYKKYKDNIPKLKAIVEANNQNKIYYLEDKGYLGKIKELAQIFENEQPLHIINYSTPWEVVLPIASHSYRNFTKRYLINLTDHAFWLGSQLIDYCIEFRDYGAFISNKYRNICKSKIVCLPYYPVIDLNKEFEGFPFPYDENKQKIVFSGGNIYKTISKDNLYYKIIDYILSNFSDVIFWYAGSGDPILYDNFNKLKSKYPTQLYVTKERKDLYQVLRKCYFYLSTYPVCGGLMMQYAAIAKKLPITLKQDNLVDDLLINQNNLEVMFDNYELLIKEINKLLKDNSYLKRKELKLENSVISEKEFQEQLYFLINTGKTKYKLDYKQINTEEFRKGYLQRLSIFDVYNFISRDSSLICNFTKEFIVGSFFRIIRKCKILLNRWRNK